MPPMKYLLLLAAFFHLTRLALADAGLIDEDAEVRWEGDYVSFPLISNLSSKND